MPEGHTLHRLAADQAELVGHLVAASSPQTRFAEVAAPRRRASSLDDPAFDTLWETLTTLMTDAVERGRIVTRPPEGRFVYKEDACGACGTPVDTFDLGGRTAYACPACQAS